MGDQERLKWELAGFIGDSGKLSPIQGHPEIIAPPSVEVVKVGGAYALKYPVPKDVALPMIRSRVGDLLKNGWERHAGRSLLEEFLALAEVDDDSAVERVKTFATRWGPLWLCDTGGGVHQMCHWSPEGGDHRRRDPCRWSGVEPVKLFVSRARQAKAALDAGAALEDGKSIPSDLWRTLGRESFVRLSGVREWIGQYGDFDRILLGMAVNMYIGGHAGGCTVSMELEPEPHLKITSGFGFIRAAWLGIAQTITDVHNLSVCDECHQTYSRRMRKVRNGERSLCPKCGSESGYRASKRRWWNSTKGKREAT